MGLISLDILDECLGVEGLNYENGGPVADDPGGGQGLGFGIER